MDVSRSCGARGSLSEQNYAEYNQRGLYEVIDALNQTESLRGQGQLLAILLRRHGENFVVDSVSNVTVKMRMEKLIRDCANAKRWEVVRFCSGMLQKVVASLVRRR